MAKKRDKISRRMFLNDDASLLAAIGFEIEGPWGLGDISAVLNISDCRKTICLEFNSYDLGGEVAAIDKIDRMMTTLSTFKTLLQSFHREAADARDEHEAEVAERQTQGIQNPPPERA